MKGEFLIRNYKFPIIIEIQDNDLMDGTPDNLSFSFYSEDNIADIINLKEKCEIQIYDSPYPIVGAINNNNIIINDINYTINNEFILNPNNEYVGSVDEDNKKIIIYDTVYLYDNNIVYKDNRKHYYMCVSQISGEKLSTNYDNGYMITVLLKEQTILLKDCVRTDIAISPSLYPQIDTGKLDENGAKIYKNIFDNLYDVTLKIIDCHNMCTLNEYIQDIDVDLIYALQKVACPNLTYRDLSTYSQLYDVFIRIGRIPYFENGILYGILLTGDNSREIYDISKYSSLSSIKEEGTNDNIYSSKVYNNVYDNEVAVVPQIFTDMVMNYNDDYGIGNVPASASTTIIPYNKYKLTNVTWGDMFTYNLTTTGNGSYNVTIDEENYSISTTSQGYAASIWLISDEGYSLVQYIGEDQTFILQNKIYKINGDYVTDKGKIMDWVNSEFNKWIDLTSQDEGDISKTLLYVKGYDNASKGIEDARTYNIELPYNIESINHIYSCKPNIQIENRLEGTSVYFGWTLDRYDDNRIIENTKYEFLSQLQKRITSYYVRGSNKINNVVCLDVPKGSDAEDGEGANWNIWDIFEVTDSDYQGAFAWSTTELYNKLRSQFYVVEYKPLMDTYYTNYDYCSEDEHKPVAINNYNLPYSQVSDKQVYPTLEYNLEKGLDTTVDIKFITEDINILDLHAGDIVLYNNSKYIVNKINRFINNKTIECSLSITNNIVQNSIVSAYSDNVRVSSIISAESTVNRPIHIFAENVIKLMDYNEDNAQTRNTDYTYFTQEVGDVLSRHGLFLLGFSARPDDAMNPYKYMSKYPFRFDTIIPDPSTIKENDTYYIKMSTGTFSDNDNYIRLTDNDFPIKMYWVWYNNVFKGEHFHDVLNYVNVNSADELFDAIYDFGYGSYNGMLTNYPTEYYYLGLRTSGGTEYTLRPDYNTDYWDSQKYKFPDGWGPKKTGNYRVYNSLNEYGTTKYGTEKLMTTSGLINKIEYSFPDSSYATSRYSHVDLAEAPIDFESNVAQSYTYDLKILNGVPVYFNTTEFGCKLAGIGNKESDFYSLYSLPHISDKAYYLDIRESPRPYIQYKTIGRDSNIIDLKQLSSEVNFMDSNVLYSFSTRLYQNFYILKCPKFTHIDTFIIPDNTRTLLDGDYIASEVNLTQLMTKDKSAVLELAQSLTKSDEYDYILCSCLLGNPDSTIGGFQILDYKNILKFNIKDNSEVNKLCLKSELYSNN